MTTIQAARQEEHGDGSLQSFLNAHLAFLKDWAFIVPKHSLLYTKLFKYIH